METTTHPLEARKRVSLCDAMNQSLIYCSPLVYVFRFSNHVSICYFIVRTASGPDYDNELVGWFLSLVKENKYNIGKVVKENVLTKRNADDKDVAVAIVRCRCGDTAVSIADASKLEAILKSQEIWNKIFMRLGITPLEPSEALFDLSNNKKHPQTS